MNSAAMLNNYTHLDKLIHANLISLVKTCFDKKMVFMEVYSELGATQHVWYLSILIDDAYLYNADIDEIVISIECEGKDKFIILSGDFTYGDGEYFLKFDKRKFDIEDSETAVSDDTINFIQDFFNGSEKNLKMMLDRFKRRC